MNNNIVDYHVVSRTDLFGLIDSVRRCMETGYQPFGNLVVTSEKVGDCEQTCFRQVVVRYSNTPTAQ